MNITNIPFVDGEELEKELGISLFDCDFLHQYGTEEEYILLDISLQNMIETYQTMAQSICDKALGYTQFLVNDLKVINYFRKLGYNDVVMIKYCQL